jgi:hypothetical protein
MTMTRRPRDYVATPVELKQMMVAEKRSRGEAAVFDPTVAEKLCDLGLLQACMARGSTHQIPIVSYELTAAGSELLAGRTGD